MTASTTDITLSERAAKRISAIVAKQGGDKALRVGVIGGGCSGFQYTFELDGEPSGDDIVLRRDGASVFIDTTSAQFLSGSEIDFVDDLIGQSFQIRNPNAVAACGCGTSFAV